MEITGQINRRDALRAAGIAIGAIVGAPMINVGHYRLFAGGPEYSARTIRLMRESLVIDMLSPLTLGGHVKGAQWNTNAENFSAADFQRYKDSGIHVFHYATGVGGTDPFASALRYVAARNSLIAGRDEYFMRIDGVPDLERVKNSGKLGILIGIQNSEHFRTPDDVDYFHSIGQRVSQLTYNTRNRIGNGCTERRDDGLSNFGVAIVERMNKLGIAVDVSHCGDRTTLDACDVSLKPVLATHTNARGASSGHPRAKTDEGIKRIAGTGGVIGITGVRNFVYDREPTTVEHFLDHYDYIKRLVGVEHLGIGSDSDLDGYDDLPAEELARRKAIYEKEDYNFRGLIDIEGINHPKRMFDVTEGLVRRRYSDAEITAILGGNFKRALSEIWTVPPLEPKASRE